jgi:uncharacterized membrane protein
VDVPHLSVTFAVGLAVAGLAVLIYFIHHIATGIQAPNLVAAIARELRDGVGHLFPDVRESDHVRPAPRSSHLPEDFAASATGVAPREAGYIQVVDVGALTKLAREHDLVIRLDRRPGRFVVPQSAFAHAAPAARVSDDVAAAISAAVVTGARRTSQDDIEFPIRQLVEIAVRALSPAINDPFTASTCVDQVGAGLCLLADRRFPSPYLEDEDGVLRVVHADPITFERLVSAAFEQIRQAASFHTAVYLHLLEALTKLAHCVTDPGRMEVVRREAGLVREAAEGSVVQAADREVVEHRFARFEEAAGSATV